MADEKKVVQAPTGTPKEIVEFYKAERKGPEIEKFNNEYDPKKHAIFTDRNKYQDRNVITDYIDEQGKENKKTITVPLNRIGLPYQKKIVSIATTFFCGNPIKYTNLSQEEDFFDSLQQVIEKNKMEFVDRETINSVGRFTEVAELWYTTEEDNEFYGFKSKFRLNVRVLSPDKYKLYPTFDENENLISFAREWKVKEITYFEVYTAENIVTFELDKDWVQTDSKPNAIGKIPIVFRQQEAVEWADVQSAIERVEGIYSNSAESNDRFAFPILKLRGKVTGQLSQDKSGRVLQLDENADAEFANQPNPGEAINQELERLDRDIHDFTNTPNISFDNMKGLGNMLAGSSAEFLFLSAHLKVMDKLSIHIPALQRRVSIIQSFLQMMNTKFLKITLEVKPVVTPFIINNEAEFIRFLIEATGGKPMYSQQFAMQRAGVKDTEEMLAQIEKEKGEKIVAPIE